METSTPDTSKLKYSNPRCTYVTCKLTKMLPQKCVSGFHQKAQRQAGEHFQPSLAAPVAIKLQMLGKTLNFRR